MCVCVHEQVQVLTSRCELACVCVCGCVCVCASFGLSLGYIQLFKSFRGCLNVCVCVGVFVSVSRGQAFLSSSGLCACRSSVGVVIFRFLVCAETIRTIADPESPDDSLYFVFIEINIDDITKLEIAGAIDENILQAFTQAGTVFCSGVGSAGY